MFKTTLSAARVSWSRNEVNSRLQGIMHDIHKQCVQYGDRGNGKPVDYRYGANIAGFVKVADAMISYGAV